MPEATCQQRQHQHVYLCQNGWLSAQVDFYSGHRNMTVTAETLGLTIRHRFTGHVNLTQNLMGLDTFFHKEFQVLAHELPDTMSLHPPLISCLAATTSTLQ